MTPNAAPFDVAPVIARLQAQATILRAVGSASDFASVTKLMDFAPPCAYVLLASERGAPVSVGHGAQNTQQPIDQNVAVTFGVVMAVRNYREQLGAQNNDSLNQVLAAVRGALLGWIPPVLGGSPCQLLRGDLSQYDKGVSLWTDVWRTHHSIGIDP